MFTYVLSEDGVDYATGCIEGVQAAPRSTAHAPGHLRVKPQPRHEIARFSLQAKIL